MIEISICIPVFNQAIAPLVQDLLPQLTPDVELFFLDDGSADQWKKINRVKAQDHEQIRYEELVHNVGRTEIRRTLATRAEGEYLLFLDGDVRVPTTFLLTYKALKRDERTVWIGGRSYPNTPADRKYVLHWAYGVKVESKVSMSGDQTRFQSNNFLLHRSVFFSIQPQITLQGYGHEDTAMGFEMLLHGSALCGVDNPVMHEGLDEHRVFVEKNKQGIRNLNTLSKHPRYSELVKKNIRIFQWIRRAWFRYALYCVPEFVLKTLIWFFPRRILLFQLWKAKRLLHERKVD